MKLESKPTDERRTPRWLFEMCDKLFGPFDLDCFAAEWNRQCDRYLTAREDYFASELRAFSAWHQPPYSRGWLLPALSTARARVLSGQYSRAVCLVPADTSTQWWKRAVKAPEGAVVSMASLWGQYPDPFGDAYRLTSERLEVTVVEVEGRVAFDGPDGPVCDGTGAKGGSAVVVFDTPGWREGRVAA